MEPIARGLPDEAAAGVAVCDQRYVAAREAGDEAGMRAALWAAWALYPEPKHGWSDSQTIVHDLIAHLRDHGRAAEALELSDEQIGAGSVLDYESEPWMYRGSVLLALGRVGEATAVFDDVLKRFGKRAFAGHDARLLVFADTGEVPEGLFDGKLSEPPQLLESELPDAVHDEIMLLAEVGDQRDLAGDWEGAVKVWRQAIELLPEPKNYWDAASWLYGSIGDTLADVALGIDDAGQASWMLADARDALIESLGASGGATNPLVHMRVGQVEQELGNAVAAREHLLKAYMLDGETVFDGQDPKYLNILRTHGDID